MTPVETSLLRRVMGYVRAALGLKQVVQGVSLAGVGLLVIFAGAFTHDVIGSLMMLWGAFFMAGGRL